MASIRDKRCKAHLTPIACQVNLTLSIHLNSLRGEVMKYWICPPAAMYAVGMVVSFALYAVVLVISLTWLKAGVDGPLKYSVAVMPVLPALGIPLAVIR